MNRLVSLFFVITLSLYVNGQNTNSLCEFGFDERGIFSKQNINNDFVIYEIPDMSASELKAATISAISTLFKSPKDVVTNLGDNIIQLERYASRVFTTITEGRKKDVYYNDMSYSLIIQFKDGKIRYNIPSIKQIWLTEVPMLGTVKLDMSKPITTLVKGSYDRDQVAKEFNVMIKTINEKVMKANDW